MKTVSACSGASPISKKPSLVTFSFSVPVPVAAEDDDVSSVSIASSMGASDAADDDASLRTTDDDVPVPSIVTVCGGMQEQRSSDAVSSGKIVLIGDILLFMAPRVHLLGVPVDAVTQQEALREIMRFLEGSEAKHVMTPNNEMLVESTKNPAFRMILQGSALNLPDSQGLLFAARWTGQKLPERVTGVDTVQALCQKLDAQHPVFLLGAGEGIAEKAAAVLQSRNPGLKIVGTFSGNPRPEYSQAIINAINASQPHLLLVAFGSPAQDLWISEFLPQMPSVRVAMGVGGTFDFIAGVRKRAPSFMRSFGLEWLWRFVQEPSRWRRMWRAVVVFPWLIIRGV